MAEYDLFGNEIIKDPILRDDFLEPPFSTLDARGGEWQKRKRLWKDKGIKSEVSRENVKTFSANLLAGAPETSVFDPALCELMYKWFCPSGGFVLDPFAGGSVRGIVANYLGYHYTGIDIRQEQVDANYVQGKEIVPNSVPIWLCGDSNKVLDSLSGCYDMVFSCPPYGDLEVYSDIEGDISNMSWDGFKDAYKSIIRKAVSKLEPKGFAVFVVGEFRNKKGNYVGFVPYTINCFEEAGAHLYNEIILLDPIGSACLRARGPFEASRKVCKVHQNVLVFKKEG